MNFNIPIQFGLISTVLFIAFNAFFCSEIGMGKAWMKAVDKIPEDIKHETNSLVLMRYNIRNTLFFKKYKCYF